MKSIIDFHSSVSGVVVYDFVSDPWGGWLFYNRVRSYYYRGWVFREAKCVVFRDPPPRIANDGRFRHIFKRVFPNGRLVFQFSKMGAEVSRRRCVDLVIRAERNGWVRKRVKRAYQHVYGSDDSKRYTGYTRGLRRRSVERVVSYLRGLKITRMSSVVRRVVKIHSTAYLTQPEVTRIVTVCPSGVQMLLTVMPCIYGRLSRWARDLGVRPRHIHQHPRFWDKYMREWVLCRWINDGFRPKDISMLLYEMFGYKITARKLAVKLKGWKGAGKAPPI